MNPEIESLLETCKQGGFRLRAGDEQRTVWVLNAKLSLHTIGVDSLLRALKSSLYESPRV